MDRNTNSAGGSNTGQRWTRSQPGSSFHRVTDALNVTVSPALIAAVARRSTDDTIDSYIGRHSVHGLATALSHTIAREQGETTHRLVADDLDITELEVEMILQALRPIVRGHFSLDGSGASLADVVDAENFDV